MRASLRALALVLAGLTAGAPALATAAPPPPAPAQAASETAAAGPVTGLELRGAIGPATAEYIVHGLHTAAARGSPFVILRMDTPGGLGSSMRRIIKAILASPIPVVGYVAPSGARAASAGTYILYACNVAVMAPATNVGAATPVTLGGSEPAPPAHPAKSGKSAQKAAAQPPGPRMTAEQRKVLNDSIAYIRSLAQLRGRNAHWAEQAVRGAASLPAEDALARHVIDFIAPNLKSLLAQLNGREVSVGGREVRLDTAGVRVVWLKPGLRTRLLAVITNPMIAYGLLLIGLGGLIFEAFHPGGVLPGVVGVISLLVALFAFQMLPTDFAGLALILVGAGMMAAEFFVPAYGSLSIGGLLPFLVGSLLLFDSGVPGLRISRSLSGRVVTGWGGVLPSVVFISTPAPSHPRSPRLPAGGQVAAVSRRDACAASGACTPCNPCARRHTRSGHEFDFAG